MSCGVGHRLGSDPSLLWLWHRPDLVLLWLGRKPAATAPTGPLAWEPPYASAAALRRQKKKKRKKKIHVTAARSTRDTSSSLYLSKIVFLKCGVCILFQIEKLH